MSRTIGIVLTLVLATAVAGAQEADWEKAVQEAAKAGDLAKVKQLCDQWAQEKPDDERPYLTLGRLYVKLKMHDRAIEPFEMAREVNPLNPEPMCELGKIFLLAGMAEEAIAEFQAALEVSKDYGPARKGLAEARGLRENPYPNGVRIKLGASNEERGLKLVEKRHPGLVTTTGGRECRSTDRANHRFYLDLDVADDYLHEVDLPVRVTVEYYDVGRDRLAMQYDSTDFTAYNGGASKGTEHVLKTDTKTWKKYTFNLPDARFSSRNGRDLVLCCDAYRRQADLYVSSVKVVQGGLQARVEPQAITAGGVGACTVMAKVFDAKGPVPDGTPVHFKTDRGTIAAKAETVAGVAKATFKSGDEPGEANVTVWTEHDQRVVTIPILRGVGKIVHRRLLVHPFGGDERWRIDGTAGSKLIVEPAPDRGREGRPATRVVYHLRQEDRKSMASMVRSIPLPGRAAKLGLWVHLDGTSNSLHIVLKDATGQTHGYILGYMKAAGWQRMELVIGAALYHRGGANDGRLHFPLEFERLTFRRYYGGGQRKCDGEVYLQDLTVETDIPGSETLELAVTPGVPNGRFGGGRDVMFRARLGNLVAQPRRGELRWTVVDGGGKTAAEGRTEPFDVGPETRMFRDLPLKLIKADLYRATFTFEPDGAEPDARAEPLTDRATFLLLNDSAAIGLSAAARPLVGGADLSLSSRRADPAQFSLSYYVLNEAREILRKGALGKPKMTLQPGETVECPLTLTGLEPDRYSILLFFDVAEGQRYSSLLSHDVLPSETELAGRVIDDTGKPVPGASVRIRLERREQFYPALGDVTLAVWSMQTDREGKYTLEDLKVPPDADQCRLSVDVVASGFVDARRSHTLRRLLRRRGGPLGLSTMRLARGEKLTARVVGADGEPAAGAHVHAVSRAAAGSSTRSGSQAATLRRVQLYRRTHYYRTRVADGAGRFELFVPPGATTDLVVYPSQWATKRVIVPPEELDVGDIQLERGTAVSGKLLDEKGQPAAGYWVVADSAHRDEAIGTRLIRVVTKTGDDGAYTLAPLKGEFTIWTPAGFAVSPTEGAKRSPLPKVAILPLDHSFDGMEERMELELRAQPQVQIAGRVVDVDGSPAKGVSLALYSIHGEGGLVLMFAGMTTGDDGRFSLDGIPRGLRGVTISAPTLRPWKRAERIYLRAKPLDSVNGAREDGSVHLEQIDGDLSKVDFQFGFWHPQKGFLDTSPKQEPETAEK